MNLDLLDRAIDWADAHPDEDHPDREGRYHDQSVWIEEEPCGTACCLAGFVALDAGWMSTNDRDPWRPGLVTKDSRALPPKAVAEIELDLGWQATEALFLASNTIGVLRRLAKDLRNGIEISEDVARYYQTEEAEL